MNYRSQTSDYRFQILVFLAFAAIFVPAGCSNKNAAAGRTIKKLVIISPHNEDIQYEFETAFKSYAKHNFEWDVSFEWRNVGGGASAIQQFIENSYLQSQSCGVDVFFGGGEYPYQALAEQGLLEKLEIEPQALAQIPQQFGGMPFYDPDMRWIGSTLGGFGFIYNSKLLQEMGVLPPEKWEDMGRAEFFNLILLADPTQSGSAAAAYEMILQTEPNWPSGWAKLLSILSNAKRFANNAGEAASGPAVGEAAIAASIDFYGIMRAAEAPDKLVYINPSGQTGYTPDPIAILKNPPNKDTAGKFVNFVLSPEGQALWGLPAGHPDGPKRSSLNRPPIRKDFYDKYEGQMLKGLSNPYVAAAGMNMNAELRRVRYGVLNHLVYAAAIANLDLMKQAKQALIKSNFDAAKLAIFNELPQNIRTIDDFKAAAVKLKEPRAAELLTSGWTSYFREKYRKIIGS